MINIAVIVGRVGKKELKDVKTGGKMVTLSVATSKVFKNADGIKQEVTNWHNVNFFGTIVESLNKIVHVGDVVAIEGEIQNKEFINEDGSKRWLNSIYGKTFQLIPRVKEKPEAPSTIADYAEDIPF